MLECLLIGIRCVLECVVKGQKKQECTLSHSRFCFLMRTFLISTKDE